MKIHFSFFIGLPILLVAMPVGAQFAPAELSELKATIDSAKPAGVLEGSATSAGGEVSPNLPITLDSAVGICGAARQANTNGTPFLLVTTDMSALRRGAASLTPDAKDQFETAAEYEARQSARRAIWSRRNQFLVLPTPINSGADVYNAESQKYVMGPSGGLMLKPSGWDDRYELGTGFVAIKIGGKFPEMEAEMNPQSARQFFAQSDNHEVVYIVQPAAPYFQKEPYSYRDRSHLVTSITCRFVRRKTDQHVIYFSSP